MTREGVAEPRTETFARGRVQLALHWLREGDGLREGDESRDGDGPRDGPGRPLLLLHGLGGRSPERLPHALAGWPGPVAALDFTGHGASSVPAGGGYHPEGLLFDVDAVLARIGEASLLGRGLGAYVALLAAGARPRLVRGAILLDGPGIEGGGPFPAMQAPLPRIEPGGGTPDPFALYELTRDPRTPEYAELWVRQMTALSGLETPMYVCGKMRPEWLAFALTQPGVAEASLDEALDRAARA